MMKIKVSINKSNGHSVIDCIDLDFDSKEKTELAIMFLKWCGAKIAWEKENLSKKRVCLLINQKKKVSGRQEFNFEVKNYD